MKILQILPARNDALYRALVKKEADLRRNGRGTFRRVGTKTAKGTKWRHLRYKGRVNLQRGPTGVVTAKVRTPPGTDDWQLMSALLGFVGRHFGDDVATITIHFA
ncbi:MAG TPA: hypothetical protein VET85_16940 [Stellaceae bacterium]|nr:hypothetical protein [Stellaceae bacterium]